ncbi:mitotic checkpoint serine/threonine-protein kinase BUB1-like [Centruroides vittatus]|uniref:mitotic checkpoint serine/threonine-protein kinase BUB1-like n=1 Tax=Centruroides vittatus TaxID=120091 RepID=UPI00350F1F35
MEENLSEWEMCKENIRPLKQGRKIDSLKSALCPTDDYKKSKRQAFEAALQNHTGDDLLEIWHEYIFWVEQNYPTGGKESGIWKLLESCVITFNDKEQYYNNEKYIEIWIKYANAHPDGIEIFRYMYSHKIGCEHAIFYENWAWSLESMGNFKHADEVLTEGIQQNAQPVEILIMRQRKLQEKLVKEIKKNLETLSDENAIQESRTALGLLNFDKQNTVPLNRSEATKLDVSVNVRQLGNLDKKKNNKKQAFNVYKDENTYITSIPSQTKNSIKIASRAEKVKENVMKPKKWSEAKIPQKNALVKHQQTFDVHIDEESTKITKKMPIKGNVLSSIKKSDWVVPLALFEPSDPKQIPMYHKHKVYTGLEEFSFEEIEAARREKLHKEEEEKLRIQTLEKEIAHLKTQFQMMKKNSSSTDIESCHSLMLSETLTEKKQLPDQISQEVQETTNVVKSDQIASQKRKTFSPLSQDGSRRNIKKRIGSKEKVTEEQHAEIVDVYQNLTDGATRDEPNDKCCENETITQPIKVTDEKKENLMCFIPTADDKYSLSFRDYDDEDDNVKLAALSAHSESFNSFNISESKKLEQSNTEKKFSQEYGRNLTSNDQVNCIVKAAMCLDLVPNIKSVPHKSHIGNLQYDNTNNNDDISNTYQRFDNPNEDITNLSTSLHTKEVTNMIRGVWYKTLSPLSIEDNTENLVNKINAENQQNGKFVFYQDPSVIISQSALPADNPNEMIDLNEEKKENMPPPDYIQEHVERPISGILQPAIDIPIEDQNQSSDDDEMVCQSKMEELTLYPPNCTEQFEAKVHIASTPFSGIKSNFSAEMNPRDKSFISESVNSGQVMQPQSFNALPYNKSNIENKAYTRNGSELSVIIEKSSEKSSSSSGMEPSANIYSYNSSHHLSSVSKTFSKSMSNELSTTTNKSKSGIKPAEKQYDDNIVDIDPFDKEVTDELLSRLDNPVFNRPGYLKINRNMPPFKIGNKFTSGSENYIIPKVIAEGAYAKIYLAKKNCENMQISRDCSIALKVCKYVNEWEFYICTEIHDRLTILNESPNVRNSIMKIEKAIIFNDAAVLCNQYEKFGSLLDIINLYKQKNQAMPECLVLYITLEMLYIFQQLHRCQIIHADVKPDNFLIVNLKDFSTISCFDLEKFNILKLIDFGRSIDMQLYPPGTSFTKVVETDGFKCTEMLDGRPWTYQTDWYGVLGSIHVMLFSEYMKLRKNKNGDWEICSKFKRYWQSDFWQSLFHTFLNIPSCSEIPDITPFINQLNKKLKEPIQINALKTKAKELCDIFLL